MTPGRLSALLLDLARAPAAAQGDAWAAVLHPGAVVGRFELVREIGRGGFGVVWEARDAELGRSVAFKAVRPGSRSDLRQERLLHEAEAAARLSHPSIVTLFDVGRAEAGPFLVMELLHGLTLGERLTREALPLPEALQVALEVARALEHAHARGVVHRDLKPDNVFLCETGQVKVLDFGLAHAFGRQRVDGGTPGYMAPEQVAGAPEDERTDVFAFGVILHELLTGRLPGPAAGGQAPAAPGVEGQPALGALVARMLHPDPLRRPRDGGEVLAALVAARHAGGAPWAPPASLDWAPLPQPARRQTTAPAPRFRLRWVALAIALAVVAGAAGERLVGWLFPKARVLAVLPFRSIGGGPADEALAAGLFEAVTSRLQALPALRVVSPSDVLKERASSAREAGAAFGATQVLTASAHWQAAQVTVALSLVDVKSALVIRGRELVAERDDSAGLLRQLLEGATALLEVGPAPAAQEPARASGAYAFYLQGRGYLQRYDRVENLASAIAVFDQALARDPAYALGHAGRAEAFLRRFQVSQEAGDLAEARSSARRALSLGAGLAPVRVTAGLVALTAGEPQEAILQLRTALELEPASTDALRELARAYDLAGRLPEAEAAYQRATELRPDWATYKALGVFYNRHGRLAEALPLFQRVVELTPDNYAGWANLGGIQLRLGHHAEAIQALERSIQLRPTGQGYANLGTVFFYQGGYAKAAEAYRQATRLDPAASQLWGNLGDAERWAGHRAEAEVAYRRALALLEQEVAQTPRDAELWSRRAIHESALGGHQPALDHLAVALRLDPADGLVLFRSALVHEEAGRREAALAAVRAALQAGYSREELDGAPPLQQLRRDPRYAAMAGAGGSTGPNPR